jgi:hypothetical protein
LMGEETEPWFGIEWLESDAKALGVYLTLLIIRFRVRYSTDIPLLVRDASLLQVRLSPYLALFLNAEQQAEGFETAKKFLKAFVERTEFPDYEQVLDAIELDFYDRFKEVYLRHVNREALTGTIAQHDTLPLLRTFLEDIAANRFARGRTTGAGSCILLTPVSDLLAFYQLSEDEVREFMKLLRLAGIMFLDIVPAPVLEEEFLETLS